MGFYDGPAWVTNPDGQEVEVHAALSSTTSSIRKSWAGTLSGPGDWVALFETGVIAKLRIDNRIGDVIVVEPGTPTAGDAPISVQGTGVPPFD